MRDAREECVWLYCVASPGAVVPEGLTGVAGEQVLSVRSAGLTAFAGLVPTAEFGAEALRGNLEDLDWLASCAEAHHQVISQITATGAVTPMRLATMCHTEQGVADLLSRRAGELKAALAQVAGCAEWGVKAYVREPEPAAQAASAAPAGTPGAPAGPGTAYLLQRRRALASREDARQQACHSAERLIAVLEPVAVGAVEHQLHAASIDPGAGDMILNWSYLVEDSRSAAFSAAVADAAGDLPALRVELTGPWPAYSFAAFAAFADEERRP
jgi:hypothetical protein